jgi:hypothetical protein
MALVVGAIPGGNGTLAFRQVAAFDSVVEVGVADGAESFVVEGDGAGDFFELFDEVVEGFEAVGGGGELGFAGAEELLEAAVDELRDFAVDDRAGADDHAEAGCILSFFDDDGGAVFRDALLVCDSADGLNIELQAAKFCKDVVPGALARLFEHGWRFP